MSSKISGIDSAPVASVGPGRAVKRPQDATSGDVGSNSSQDSFQDVQITGTARHLADLEQKVRDLPPINEQRVSEIRTAIEQGTYNVRPQHIADNLMSLERALAQLPDGDESGAAEK